MKEQRFVIEYAGLRPCDIILSADRSITSKGIRFATLGRFSHAAIFVGGTAIEATLRGVFSRNPQRMIFDHRDHVAVYRSRTPLSDDQVRRIVEYARAQVGSLYALTEAITIRARSALGIEETRRQFCSRLVAKSYESAGYDLRNLRNPSYCTPRQLSLCKAFYRVEDIVRAATEDEVEFANSPDPIAKHHEQTFDWLNKVRQLAKATSGTDIQTIGEVADFLLIYPDFDGEICGLLEQSGYLSGVQLDRALNEYRYNLNEFMAKALLYRDPITFIEYEMDKEPPILDVYATNVDRYFGYAQRRKLRFFVLHIELYVALIEGIQDRINILALALERFGESESALELRRLGSHVASMIKQARNRLDKLD